MQVLYPRCCGLDIHQKTVVACVLLTDPDGASHRFVRTFGTMTADLLALGDWLEFHAVTHVAMESTGILWRPVFNVLEEGRALILVNAQPIKAVPGRKTDVKLRHDVASIAVEQEQSRLDLVYCHQSPTRPCEQSNLLV
jgi:transposase